MRNFDDIKITIFGDSILKGIVTDSGKLEKLENSAVSNIAKHFNLDIKNVSVYGQTLSRIYQKGLILDYINNLDTSKKNIAVLSVGGNDSDYNWQEVEKSPALPHKPKTTLDEFKNILTLVINQIKSAGAKVYVTTIPPVDSKRYFENVICKIADGNKILEFFNGDVNTIYRHQELFNNAIMQIAKKTCTGIIDIRTPFLKRLDFLNLMCNDGIHPNQNGHNLMATEIIKQIENKGDIYE